MYSSLTDTSKRWLMIAAGIVLALFLVFAVASCNRQPTYGTSGYPVPVATAPAATAAPAQAPVTVVNSGSGHSNSGVNDMITGGLLGYMIGSAGNRSQTTVIHQPSVTTTAPAQRYAPSPSYSRPTTTVSRSAPTIRPSTTTNSRGVSTTTTSKSTSFGTRRR